MRAIVVGAVMLGACGRVAFDAASDARSGDGGSLDGTDGDATLTYPELIESDGPIAYYRMSSLSPIVDEIAAANGTLVGSGCSLTSGLIANDADSSLKLGGFCAVDLGNTLYFGAASAWTIEAWVVWSGTALTGNYQHLFTRETRSGGPDDGYALVYDEVGPGVFVERSIGAVVASTSNAPLPAGQAIYLAAVYDGATLSLYRQGVMASQVSDGRAMPAFTANAYIGWGPDPADMAVGYFAGEIDELAAYDRALQASEIAEHYAAGRSM